MEIVRQLKAVYPLIPVTHTVVKRDAAPVRIDEVLFRVTSDDFTYNDRSLNEWMVSELAVYEEEEGGGCDIVAYRSPNHSLVQEFTVDWNTSVVGVRLMLLPIPNQTTDAHATLSRGTDGTFRESITRGSGRLVLLGLTTAAICRGTSDSILIFLYRTGPVLMDVEHAEATGEVVPLLSARTSEKLN